MSDIKWIKIVTDIFDDEKILLIESMPDADSVIVLWFKLLCMAGKQNNSGVFTVCEKVPYTDEMFSTVFRRPLNTVRMALKMFEQFHMIEIIENTVTIPNWGKHQNIEGLEHRKEYMKDYMQNYRVKQLALIGGKQPRKHLRSSLCKQNVNCPDKEKNIEIDKSTGVVGGNPPRTQFRKPSLEEIAEYAAEIEYAIKPGKFYDHYETNGWMAGKVKMKDWKSALRKWKRTDDEKRPTDNEPGGQADVFR